MSTGGTPESDEEPEEGRNDAKFVKGCGLGCGGLVLVFILLIVAFSCGASDEGDDWEPTAWEARQICEGWVENQLKAPSTAEFTDGTEVATDVNAWTVTGTVDAQNSFGAMLRSTWSCDIRWDASTERWRGNATVSS